MVRPTSVATRSLTFTYPGSHPHWTYNTVPLPIPVNQILIQVTASTLSSCDIFIWNTQMLWAKPGEKGLGRDFAGVVTHVGSNHEGKWKVGDEVCGMYYHPYGAGTLASHVLLNPARDAVIRKPEILPTLEAAAFPLSFSLAYQCLKNAPLTPSSTVCVFGGTTSIGIFAIQLAKKHFMVQRVVATCSAGDSEVLARYMGADDVVDYTRVDERDLVDAVLATAGESMHFDLVVDTVGTTPVIMERLKDLTPPKTGWYVTTVGDKDHPEGASFLSSSSLGKTLVGAVRGPRYKVEGAVPNVETLKLAMELYEQQSIRILIDSVLGWDNYQEAMDKLQGGSAHGKIVIKIDEF
ncbi:GroES-like protein [Lipomyces orientalis]|uniref:GroES-like protein n=1 Tax=Lipomyces orientalis TaxID=1233043 RepID=A0ACC3TR33_9ASCO